MVLGNKSHSADIREAFDSVPGEIECVVDTVNAVKEAYKFLKPSCIFILEDCYICLLCVAIQKYYIRPPYPTFLYMNVFEGAIQRFSLNDIFVCMLCNSLAIYPKISSKSWSGNVCIRCGISVTDSVLSNSPVHDIRI